MLCRQSEIKDYPCQEYSWPHAARHRHADRCETGLTLTKSHGFNMGNVGGKRNYGYGKQLAWAGQQALRDRYGGGHYATRATHVERWLKFAQYLREQGINDARQVNPSIIEGYAQTLKQAVDNKTLSVAYAQNLLSTVNVVLEALRKDRALSISPRHYVGERSHTRQNAPCLDKRGLTDNKAIGRSTSEAQGQDYRSHVLMIARLARDFGLRFREASLLDTRQALKEAGQYQRINITQGTKGGRGNEKDRWVPATPETLHTLQQAADLQQQQRNLIPAHLSYVQWRNHAYSQWRPIARSLGIKGFHELRAAYACERYQQITGYPAPVITSGVLTAPRDLDRQARLILAQELGHGRIDVIAAYIAGAR